MSIAMPVADLLWGTVLVLFSLIRPWWMEAALLAGTAVLVWLMTGRRRDAEGLGWTVGRLTACTAAWFLPYHIVLFQFILMAVNERWRPPIPDRGTLRKVLLWEVLAFVLLAAAAWLSHAWSTVQITKKVSIIWFRPPWVRTVLAFTAVGMSLRWMQALGTVRSHPGFLFDLPLGWVLLYWAARLADFRLHIFDAMIVTAPFLVVVTTLFFYLTDMIDRRDALRIALGQYALTVLGGSRAFLVFLVVFCLYYLLRRGYSETEAPKNRAYRVYFSGPTPVYAAVPILTVLLFVFMRREASTVFLAAFSASWLPMLLEAGEVFRTSKLHMSFHNRVWERVWRDRLKSVGRKPEASFGLLRVLLALVYAGLLVLLAKLPAALLAILPLGVLVLDGLGAAVRRLALPWRVEPTGAWHSLLYGMVTATTFLIRWRR